MTSFILKVLIGKFLSDKDVALYLKTTAFDDRLN